MINLLVVGLWLTFLICVVGFILYNEINKSKKSSLELVQENRRLEMLFLKAENTCNYLKSSNAKKIEEFEEEAKKFRATLVQKDDQLENLYLQTLSLQEDLEKKQEKSLSNFVEEEWIQYFPVNISYPTILETWVSSLGIVKHIHNGKTVYTHYDTAYTNSKLKCFDNITLSLLIARCFLASKDEKDMVIILDKTKSITKDNVMYVDKSEMQFFENKVFGTTESRERWIANYRGNTLGYFDTQLEAQKVVYNYRKQWLIDNDRAEWLDLWKPNFVE